jgi:hypothetical protein
MLHTEGLILTSKLKIPKQKTKEKQKTPQSLAPIPITRKQKTAQHSNLGT